MCVASIITFIINENRQLIRSVSSFDLFSDDDDDDDRHLHRHHYRGRDQDDDRVNQRENRTNGLIKKSHFSFVQS